MARSKWFVIAIVVCLALMNLSMPMAHVHAAGTWYVAANGSDSNGCNSPAQACLTIQSALNVAGSGDTIMVATATYTASSGSQVITIAQSVVLSGGWNATFTAQGSLSAIDGQLVRRGMVINGGPAFIDHFVITRGLALNGAGLLVNANTLLTDSAVYANTASGSGASGGGAQVTNAGSLSVVNSTFAYNTADPAHNGTGGAIATTGAGIASLFSVTLGQNTAQYGGGIANGIGASVTLRDTLLATNISGDGNGGDCSGTLTSQTYNLVGVVGSTCTLAAQTGDQLGSLAVPLNPSLDPYSGGVLPLRADSPAIDAGDPSGCLDASNHVLTTDQLGQPRLGPCDIGAYESQVAYATSTPITPNTSTPTNTSTSTNTPTATNTATPTPTSTATYIPSATPTLTPHPQTIGLYDRTSGTFYLRNSNTTGYADLTFAFGGSGQYPVAGDWIGSGFDTIGVYNRQNGLFLLRNADSPGPPDEQFVLGIAGDQPFSGRWQLGATHDGVGVFRPSNGLIFLKKALTTGYADFTMVLGIPGDQGLAGDWTGKGFSSPGVYRSSIIRFYLSDQVCNCAVYADHTQAFGIANELPLTGDWTGLRTPSRPRTSYAAL